MTTPSDKTPEEIAKEIRGRLFMTCDGEEINSYDERIIAAAIRAEREASRELPTREELNAKFLTNEDVYDWLVSRNGGK